MFNNICPQFSLKPFTFKFLKYTFVVHKDVEKISTLMLEKKILCIEILVIHGGFFKRTFASWLFKKNENENILLFIYFLKIKSPILIHSLI
jgi:hypothetical protein